MLQTFSKQEPVDRGGGQEEHAGHKQLQTSNAG